MVGTLLLTVIVFLIAGIRPPGSETVSTISMPSPLGACANGKYMYGSGDS